MIKIFTAHRYPFVYTNTACTPNLSYILPSLIVGGADVFTGIAEHCLENFWN